MSEWKWSIIDTPENALSHATKLVKLAVEFSLVASIVGEPRCVYLASIAVEQNDRIILSEVTGKDPRPM
jgi:hypothetical protein